MTLIRSNRSRDLRVDFFRGLALWWIYTDHIPGDVLGKYSLQNFALCDAAEVFSYCSLGSVPEFAYGTTMNRPELPVCGGRHAACFGPGPCISAHIFLFVVYAAQVSPIPRRRWIACSTWKRRG